MRTNIEIDDDLLAKAMKAAGGTTKKAAVAEALELFVRIKGQGEVRKLRGKIQWEGDLIKSREGRSFDWNIEDER